MSETSSYRALNCPMCGATIKSTDKQCPYCNANLAKYNDDKTDKDYTYIGYVSRFNDCYNYMVNMDFAEAEQSYIALYDDIRKVDPESSLLSFAALGVLKTKFLVKDVIAADASGRDRWYPTFCGMPEPGSKISENDWAKKALYYCDDENRPIITRQLREIDSVRSKWLRIRDTDDKRYKIFISFKNLVEGSEKVTEERKLADQLFKLLTKKYGEDSVFFSPVSLKGGADCPEARIYQAINTASVMIVIGFSDKRFNSGWVKNEWMRFNTKLQTRDWVGKGSIIPIGMNAGSLDVPYVLKKDFECKAVNQYNGDMAKFFKDILVSVANVLGDDEAETPAMVPEQEAETVVRSTPRPSTPTASAPSDDTTSTTASTPTGATESGSTATSSGTASTGRKSKRSRGTSTSSSSARSTGISPEETTAIGDSVRPLTGLDATPIGDSLDDILPTTSSPQSSTSAITSGMPDLDAVSRGLSADIGGIVDSSPATSTTPTTPAPLFEPPTSMRSPKRTPRRKTRNEPNPMRDFYAKKRWAILAKVLIVTIITAVIAGALVGGFMGIRAHIRRKATLKYKYDETMNGYVVSSGLGYMPVLEVVIPDKHNGKPVVAIADKCFLKGYGLKKIVLPDTIVSIGRSAFEKCTNLETINIPAHLEVIEENAFLGCRSLGSDIRLPNTLRRVESRAFANTKITGLTIAGESRIQSKAFANCLNLSTVDILDSVLYLEGEVFYGDTGVTVRCGKNSKKRTWHSRWNCIDDLGTRCTVSTLANETFYCNGLNCFFDDDHEARIVGPVRSDADAHVPAEYIDDNGRRYPFKSISNTAFTDNRYIKHISIDGNAYMDTLWENAFKDCTSLETVRLGSGIKRIDSTAFDNCFNLREIHLDGGLENIDGETFKDCTKLEKITISGRGKYDVVGNSLYEVSTKRLVLAANGAIVPSDIESIGSYAFIHRDARNVRLGKELVEIDKYAFANARLPKELVIPEKTIFMHDSAFLSVENTAFYAEAEARAYGWADNALPKDADVYYYRRTEPTHFTGSKLIYWHYVNDGLNKEIWFA